MRIYGGLSFEQLVAGAAHECQWCASLGGMGPPVRPGERCRYCSWQAPGSIGDDIDAAILAAVGMTNDLGGPAKGLDCRFCGAAFRRIDTRRLHERTAHRKVLIEMLSLGTWRERLPGPTPFMKSLNAWAARQSNQRHHWRVAPRASR